MKIKAGSTEQNINVIDRTAEVKDYDFLHYVRNTQAELEEYALPPSEWDIKDIVSIQLVLKVVRATKGWMIKHVRQSDMGVQYFPALNQTAHNVIAKDDTNDGFIAYEWVVYTNNGGQITEIYVDDEDGNTVIKWTDADSVEVHDIVYDTKEEGSVGYLIRSVIYWSAQALVDISEGRVKVENNFDFNDLTKLSNELSNIDELDGNTTNNIRLMVYSALVNLARNSKDVVISHTEDADGMQMKVKLHDACSINIPLTEDGFVEVIYRGNEILVSDVTSVKINKVYDLDGNIVKDRKITHYQARALGNHLKLLAAFRQAVMSVILGIPA